MADISLPLSVLVIPYWHTNNLNSMKSKTSMNISGVYNDSNINNELAPRTSTSVNAFSQSQSFSNLHDNMTHTSDSLSESGSSSTFLDNKYQSLMDLREKFELWLYSIRGQVTGNSIFQKLLFLDEFYDPSKERLRKILYFEDLFYSLEKFLQKLLKPTIGLINSTNDNLYPYLMYLSNNNNKENINNILLKEHLYLNDFIKEVQFLTNNMSLVNNNDISDKLINNLKRLIEMFSIELNDHFNIFQENQHKIITKWFTTTFTQNNNNLYPKYILENIQKRKKRIDFYLNKKQLNDDDFNIKNILDTDFEFINYLSEYTNGIWQLKSSLNKDFITTWKSDKNFTTIPNTRLQKSMGYVNFKIEDCCKAISHDDVYNSSQMTIEECSHHNYESINPNNSLRKYPTYIHTAIFDFGTKIFRKRSLENCISVKAQFIGGQLQSFIQIYKTCCHVMKELTNDEPLKIITFGAKIFYRVDKNRTFYQEVKMGNIKGFLNNNLILNLSLNKLAKKMNKNLQEIVLKMINNQMSKPLDESNFGWKAIVEYCKHYYKIDPNEWF
ncbi:hypothetical protein ABK040_012420 [Willaertia magna]